MLSCSSEISKAVFLVNSRVAVAAAGCSKGSLARALKALQEGRKLQRNGRPPRLNEGQEQHIKDEIQRQALRCTALRGHAVLKLANTMLKSREDAARKRCMPVDPVVEECLLDRASTPLTKGYLKSFIKRTEDSDEALRSTTPRYVDNLRAEVQREDLTQFFELRVASQTDLRKYHPFKTVPSRA